MDWPADNVERRPISSLIPSARNARTHSEAQIGQLAASIREWGWTMPVLVDETGSIIAGHGRVLAAARLGIGEVPTMVARGWSEAQKRAYVIADNKLTENGGWDEALLRVELQDLEAMGFDALLTGFTAAEIKAMGTVGKTDPDEVPEAPAVAVSKLGDVWVLGRHRLMCGGATKVADVARLLDGQRIDMLLTDPPYCSGGFQEAGKAAGSVGTRGTEMIANDTLSTRGYMALMKLAIPSFAAGVVYVFTDWRMWINLFDVVESSGYGVRNMIVWDKGTPGMGAGWRMQHELIMCGIRVKSPFNRKKAQGNVIAAKRTGNVLHATEKPVDLLTTIIDVTDMAESVADPFCGSGTTIIAAEMTGRACRALEVNPAYVDVAVLRWQNFTGNAAVLEATGEPFPQREEQATA
jgi:DNA modification methylase